MSVKMEDTTDINNPVNLDQDEFPFYDNDPIEPTVPSSAIKPSDIPQGQGSRLDSDTLDGYQLSTAEAPTPNTVVPIDDDGILPESIRPTIAATSGIILVQSQNVTAGTSVTFTGLVAETMYVMEYNLVQNTSASQLFLRFNADSGAVYRWTINVVLDSPTSAAQGNGGDTEAQLCGNSQMSAGSHSIGNAHFASKPGTNTIVSGTGSMHHFDSNTSESTAAYQYSNTAISSVQLHTGAGTMTGTVKLFKKV